LRTESYPKVWRSEQTDFELKKEREREANGLFEQSLSEKVERWGSELSEQCLSSRVFIFRLLLKLSLETLA